MDVLLELHRIVSVHAHDQRVLGVWNESQI